MKWLKRYKLFLEQDEVNPLSDDTELSNNNDKVNQDSLKMVQVEISEFKSKKGVLEEIFKDVEKSDSDIEDELLSKVYSNKKDVKDRNKFLKGLEGVFRLKRLVDRISMAIEDDNSKKLRTEKQLNELRDRFNEVDSEKQKSKISDQIEKSRDYLKRINDNISENKKKYSEMDKRWNEKKREFESMMRTEEERIKKLI